MLEIKAMETNQSSSGPLHETRWEKSELDQWLTELFNHSKTEVNQGEVATISKTKESVQDF